MVLQPAFFNVVKAFSVAPLFLKMAPELSISGRNDKSAARIKRSSGALLSLLPEQENSTSINVAIRLLANIFFITWN